MIEKHKISDWLEVHKVTETIIKKTMESAIYFNRESSSTSIDHQKHTGDVPTASNAWNLVSTALCEYFVFMTDSIELAQSTIEKNLQADEYENVGPFTLDRRPNEPPFVSLTYKDNPSDLVCVAHEFAHAVQIHCSTQSYTAPVLRELAAFIGELTLVTFIANTDIKLSKQIHSVWGNENDTYFGLDLDNLLTAIEDGNTIYDYRWNYPVARLLALRLFETCSAEQLWHIFCGDVSLTDCIVMADILSIEKSESSAPSDYGLSKEINDAVQKLEEPVI